LSTHRMTVGIFTPTHVNIIPDHRLVWMVPTAWLDSPSSIWLMLLSLLMGKAC